MFSNVIRVERRVDARRRADEFRPPARDHPSQQQRIPKGMKKNTQEDTRVRREDVCYREGQTSACARARVHLHENNGKLYTSSRIFPQWPMTGRCISLSTRSETRFYGNVHVNICCSLRSEAEAKAKAEAKARRGEARRRRRRGGGTEDRACVSTFVQSVPLKLRRDLVYAGESALQLSRGAEPFDRSTDPFPFDRPDPPPNTNGGASRCETTRDDAARSGAAAPARGGTDRLPVY